jgi:hypothetical protein
MYINLNYKQKSDIYTFAGSVLCARFYVAVWAPELKLKSKIFFPVSDSSCQGSNFLC